MPDWKEVVRRKLPALPVKPARESEIVAELAMQMEQAYSEALAGGATETEAAARAESQFRDWPALAREIESAEQPRERFWNGGWRDVRYGARFLSRNPMFAAIASLTLAFGIGANTAIFTVADAVALRGLPYRDAGRLMAIETRKAQQAEVEAWSSAADFYDFRDRSRAFSTIAGISPVWNMIMTGRGEAEQLTSLWVSAEFFPMLGVNAALGRVFLQNEDQRGHGASVVVLSDSFWKRRFAGDRGIIGQSLALDSGTYQVIGVMPAGFRWAGEPLNGTAVDVDAWLPMNANQLANTPRLLRFLKVVGRLRPGVTVAHAKSEAASIGAALAEQYAATNRGFVWDAQLLEGQVSGRYRVAMLLLLGTVGLVLLMACANAAGLLLSRAAARQREIAVRMALGASRFRLIRQLLVEGALLAAAGALCGIALAYAGVKGLVAVGPESLVRTHDIGIDLRALLFTVGAALAAALTAGAPPAWRMVRGEIETTLRESGRTLSAGHHRLRASLVMAQVGMALMLLVGAGLLIRSFLQLLNVNPGFDARNLVTISTQMPPSANTPAKRKAVLQSIREQLAATPGVKEVAAVSRLPLMGSNLGTWLFVEGKYTPGEPGHDVEYRVATPNYFATMGIPLRSGRWFDDHDDANPGAVALINETTARRYWPGEDANGKRVKLGTPPEQYPWVTIVGVVGDVHHFGIDTEPRPEIYRPYAVNPLGAPILVVRTDRDAAAMMNPLAAKVRSVSAGVPTYNIYPMEKLVDRSIAQRRFVMLLLAGFAATALLMAGVGIYGTVSHLVQQRTQEIGLRMALGASPLEALRLIFGQGIRLAAGGVALGWAASAVLTRLMQRLLFEVRPLDPAAFVGAAMVLLLFASAACYVPARRATRVDPMAALRNE